MRGIYIISKFAKPRSLFHFMDNTSVISVEKGSDGLLNFSFRKPVRVKNRCVYKIGHSNNIERRFLTLKSRYNEKNSEIELIGCIEFTYSSDLEWLLHNNFRKKNIVLFNKRLQVKEKEWFLLEDEDFQKINSINKQWLKEYKLRLLN